MLGCIQNDLSALIRASKAWKMASVLVRQARLLVLKNSRVPTFSGFYANVFGEAPSHYRTVVYSASGGILPKPKKVSAVL